MIERRSLLKSSLAIGLLCNFDFANAQTPSSMDGDNFDDVFTSGIDQSIQSGLKYLKKKERSGTFETERWGKNLGICSLVGLAFLSRGFRVGDGPEGKLIQRICDRIVTYAGSSGFINDEFSRSHGPMYEHAFATLFLTEVHGTAASADFTSTIKAAIDLVVRSQNSQGGWRYDPRPTEADVSVTVSQIMALRAAKNAGFFVPEETVQRAIEYLKRAQNPDGGFAYQLDGSPSRFALTAGALVAMFNSGVNEGKVLDDGFAFMERMSEAERLLHTNYFYYAHYYSAQAFWHRGGESWPQWYNRLAAHILPLQAQDGSWIDQNQGSEYATAMACLILNTPRSLLPIYQR
jgi:hypothetical protein